MKKNIHVLVMPSWYPTSETPLNGIFFKEQAQNLLDFNIKVGIVYAEMRWLTSLSWSNLKKHHFQIKQYNEDGILTIRKHSWNKFPRFPRKQAMNRVREFVKLADIYIKKYGKPDIIHAHSVLWGGYAAMIVSKKYNIPYIITEHSTAYARGLIKDWQEVYIREAFENANKTLAVSSPFAEILHKYSPRTKIDVLNNPVKVEFFEVPKHRKKDPFIFLSVAFLMHKKGIDLLIKAFHKAFYKNENVKLKIAGDGEERKNLEQLVQKLDLCNKVSFLGQLTRENVKKEMMESNVFVLPSRFETFGVVFIEALASGMPVIGTRCGGPEDIISKDVGKLVDNEDINGLSEALKEVYEKYDSYDSVSLRDYCVNKFSSQSITNKLLNIYDSVLKL